MSSLSAMTRSFSLAFMGQSLLLAPGHVGAADALGLGRGDLAGVERNLPGAPHLGPPFLAFRPLGLADEAKRLVLALHAGDGELHAGLWRRHDQRVDHLVICRRVFRLLGELAAGDHEIGPVLALILVDVDRRGDEAAAKIVPTFDVEIAVIVLADVARGEGGVGVFLLARSLWLGAREKWHKRESRAKQGDLSETGKTGLHGGIHGKTPGFRGRGNLKSIHNHGKSGTGREPCPSRGLTRVLDFLTQTACRGLSLRAPPCFVSLPQLSSSSSRRGRRLSPMPSASPSSSA